MAAFEAMCEGYLGINAWMLFGLMCWSCSPYSNNTPRMNRPAGMEKPRSWKATNDTTYPLRARHELIAGGPPLDDDSERRKLSCFDKAEELLAGNVGVRPVRHRGSEVLGGLEAQAVAARWMLRNSERRRQAREGEDGKAKSRTNA
jgi:hypothetical protein